MNFSEIVSFIQTNWPTIIGVIVIVSPTIFFITKFLFESRLEEKDAEIRQLKNSTSKEFAAKEVFKLSDNNEVNLREERHEHALKVYQYFFDNYRDIEQTMFTPKYTPLADDMVFKNNWINQSTHLTRIYGINNSVDLKSANLFYHEISKQKNIDVRVFEMLDLSPSIRGRLPNITLGKKSDLADNIAVSIPELARSDEKEEIARAVSFSEDVETVRFWKNYFELFKSESKFLPDVYKDLEKRIDTRNRNTISYNVKETLHKAEDITGIEFASAFVGSFLVEEKNDWTHRDIDILVFISENCSWSILQKFKDIVSQKLKEDFRNQFRNVVIDFNDGPVKVMPSAGVETWQFHILIDTKEHVSKWPTHVKIRRNLNIEWLDIGDKALKNELKKIIGEQKPINAAKKEIIERGFGLDHCLQILKQPIYHYREITGSFNSSIDRRAKTKDYLFSDGENTRREKTWRDTFLMHYCVYNFCFNSGLYFELENENHENFLDKQKDLSLVIYSLENILSDVEFNKFKDVANRIDEHMGKVRSEYIFPSYGIQKRNDRLDELLKVTTQLREDIMPYLEKANSFIINRYSEESS